MWRAFSKFVWRLRDRNRTLICAPLGICAGVIGWKLLGWIPEAAFLVGWNVGVGSYLALLGCVIFTADGPMTQQRVSKDDPSPRYLLIVLITVALLGNAAVGIILTSVGNRPAVHATLLLVLSVLSVILSWFLMHAAFGQQYARTYYTDLDEKGRPFPGGMRADLTFPEQISPVIMTSSTLLSPSA
jgi:uncharacterized membrane protein